MSAVLDQKLKKALELRTDTPVMLEALDSIGEFWESNTLEARRNLRQELEHQNVALARQFISAFAPLEERLEKVGGVVDALEASCGTMATRVSQAEQAMQEFTKRANELTEKRKEVQQHAEEVSAFLSQYSMSDEEVEALLTLPIETPSADGQGIRFFHALGRLREVRDECCRLVGSKHQSAAFELLEVLSQQQEKAYDRVYEWVQQRANAMDGSSGDPFGIMDIDDSAHRVFREALTALRARPGFFRHCQECVASARRTGLVQRFIAALTIGGPGGTPRPIELQAHDPVRYLGDMLAWMHQALASERDFLASLFADDDRAPGALSVTPPSGGGGGVRYSEGEGVEEGDGEGVELLEDSTPRSLSDLLSFVVEGMARPLRVRATGVIEAKLSEGTGTGSLVLSYRLYHLVAFYHFTVVKVLRGRHVDQQNWAAAPKGSFTSLEATLGSCRLLAVEAFSGQLQRYAEQLGRAAPTFPLDLSTSATISEHLKRLTELLQIHTDSFLSDEERRSLAALDPVSGQQSEDVENEGKEVIDVPVKEDECGIEAILATILEPLLTTCRQSAEGRLDAGDTATLMINAAHTMHGAVESFQTAADWSRDLTAEMQTWLGVLVSHEAERLLGECGLTSLLQTMEVMKVHGTASEQPGLDAASVERAMLDFYSTIFALAVPSFERLAPLEVREAARKGVAERIANAHQSVYNLVKDPANKYGDSSFLQHTPEQVRMLL
eukprot:CAMPEP_0118980786 /NCGR_PEP_ID=MMETSP1173-20130426/29108_1 /TAXON_ID=1034831 /ORGANISM="Rhizochromulina marina cf, Strain CCMP1243" /LENGTH=726 /DNA_ID=CAMNT_0006931157 /DNA_START=89 /DNA_END=2265 /DNA_ORIENTATION=-